MSDKEIEVGDKVDVTFPGEGGGLCNVEVLHIAAATGDSWRFMDDTGKLFYVQQYECIIRRTES